MTPLEYLRKLQADKKTERGFHTGLRAWVDDRSEVARVLAAYEEEEVHD